MLGDIHSVRQQSHFCNNILSTQPHSTTTTKGKTDILTAYTQWSNNMQ